MEFTSSAVKIIHLPQFVSTEKLGNTPDNNLSGVLFFVKTAVMGDFRGVFP